MVIASPPQSALYLLIRNIAGGQAVDSNMKRMLSVVPEHIHDRSGIFLGSYDEVQKVIDTHKKHGVTA